MPSENDEIMHYRDMDDLAGVHNRVGNELVSTVNSVLPQNRLIMGFGSFWQCPERLSDKSDIDYLVLNSEQPLMGQVDELRSQILSRVQTLIPQYELNGQLFVGGIGDIATGAENIVRCLTIHDPNILAPVVLRNKEANFHLLKMMNRARIDEYFREVLFNIQRHLNTNVLIKGSNALGDDKYRLMQQKFFQRFISANFLAQKFFGDDVKIRLPKRIFGKYLNRELNWDEITEISTLLKVFYK